jgi:phytanoyl-CoA hydroxylase
MEIAPHEHPDWEHVNFGYVGVRDLGPDERRVHFELEPGDTLFFHPHLVHGSGRNKTQGFRRSILTHYASADCEFVEAIANALPQRHYVPVRGRRPVR